MTRWSICLCAVLFVAACTDGGPGTETPGMNAGTGGANMNPTAGSGGASGAGNAGSGGSSGAGGVSGAAGTGGGSAGLGGFGGTGGMDGATADASVDSGDDDGGVDDEGYCTVACTGIPPDDDATEACSEIAEEDACTLLETGSVPASCRWVTPDSEPCLAP